MQRLSKPRTRRILSRGIFLGGVLAAPAWAATITVSSNADTGAGTLRDAVATANAGDTIDFDLAYPATIFVTTTIPVTRTLTITGPGAGNLALDGADFATPMLQVSGGPTLSISDLTMQNGAMSAIANVSGTVLVNHSVFFNNYAPSGGAIVNGGGMTVSNTRFTNNRSGNQGGAIYNNAGATLTNCSFTGNSAVHDGGAIASYGGMEIDNSTFSGNKSTGDIGGRGGAILNQSALTIKTSTFTGNATSGSGGAIWNRNGITLTSSTISANSAATSATGIYNLTGFTISRSIVDGSCNGGSPLVSNGDNIDSDGSCISDSSSLNDRSGLNPKLLALAGNGGPTQTMALQATSPALDQVIANDATCAGTDQRGFVRPVGAHCDIGAVEMDFNEIFASGFE